MTQKERFEIRLTKAESEKLANVAARQGVSKANVVRWLISKLPGGEAEAIPERKRPDQRRQHKLRIRFTDDQYQAIVNRATLDKWQRPSAWIYSLVISHIETDPVMTEDELERLEAMEGQLRRIGNNVNQIAKAANKDPRAVAQLEAWNFDALRSEIKKAAELAEAIQAGAEKRWGMK